MCCLLLLGLLVMLLHRDEPDGQFGVFPLFLVPLFVLLLLGDECAGGVVELRLEWRAFCLVSIDMEKDGLQGGRKHILRGHMQKG